MTVFYSKIELEKIYNDSKESLKGKKLNRYHLGSVKNIILHYEALNGSAKIEVSNLTSDYLYLLREIEFPASSEDSQFLYENYIFPIIKNGSTGICVSIVLGLHEKTRLHL